MEKTISVEEKIKRAEEIYERRHRGDVRPTVKISNEGKKDLKLFKKLILQVFACLLIYLIIYTLQNNDSLFSHDFIEKAREILSYDTDFVQMYNNTKNSILSFFSGNMQENNSDINIGGGEDENIESSGSNENTNEAESDKSTESNENVANTENTESLENSEVTEENKTLTEEEKIIEKIKSTTSFIKPVNGTISSKYGQRETTIATVPKNHTGTDIAANLGTKIWSATDGEVVLASSEGDYR